MNLFQLFGILLTNTGNLLEQNQKLEAQVAEQKKDKERIAELEKQLEAANGALQKSQ